MIDYEYAYITVYKSAFAASGSSWSGFKLLGVKRRVRLPSDPNEKPISCVAVSSGPAESVLFADAANDSVRRLTENPPNLDVVYRSGRM